MSFFSVRSCYNFVHNLWSHAPLLLHLIIIIFNIIIVLSSSSLPSSSPSYVIQIRFWSWIFILIIIAIKATGPILKLIFYHCCNMVLFFGNVKLIVHVKRTNRLRRMSALAVVDVCYSANFKVWILSITIIHFPYYNKLY